MFRVVKKIIKMLYKIKLKFKYNVFLGKKVNYTINTIFEGNNKINNNSSIDNCKIGFATYIGENCHFRNTKIGKYCSIANNVKTITTTHPVNTFVSTHPAFFSLKKQAGFTFVKMQKFEETIYIDKKTSVEIGNDVWIGEDVTILAGVKIGDGCIIGAKSIVTKDLPNYSICVGNPAHVIKYRFDKETIEFLEQKKWWDMPYEWLLKNADLFENIENFKGMDIWKN